jgi:NADH-ubiquinone oxidoreductase chain 1
MTEHAAVIFVFFFLAEYASIVLICILTSILFLGGYLLNIMPLLYLWYIIDISTVYLVNDLIPAFYSFFILLKPMANISLLNPFSQESLAFFITEKESWRFDPLFEGIFSGVILGVKSCIMIFVFIWARASFPRIRFDQLMSFCWTILLPLVIAFIILVPCILYSFEILPSNTIFF